MQVPQARSVARRDAWIIARTEFSTYFHRRMAHLTALRVLRLGAWSAVMLAHHKGRATTSEEPARPPEGSFFAASGGRHRRLTMSRHRQRDASYPEAAKRRSYVPSSYESKYSGGKPLPTLLAASGKYSPSRGSRHARAETVPPLAHEDARLVGAFHRQLPRTASYESGSGV